MHFQNFMGLKLEEKLIHVCSKWEWIRSPDSIDEWYDKETALALIEKELTIGRSPMIWIKGENTLTKLFIIPDGQVEAA
jgi:hypothetical protein